MNAEIWKDVLQYDGKYQVSSKGNVRRQEPDGTYTDVSVRFARNETMVVGLSKTVNGKSIRKTVQVKRIEAEAFIPNPDPTYYKCVICKDCNDQNLDVENLMWANHSQSKKQRIAKGKVSKGKRKIRDLSTGVVYDSYARCCRELGIDPHKLRRIVDTDKEWNNHKFASITPQGVKRSVKFSKLAEVIDRRCLIHGRN